MLSDNEDSPRITPDLITATESVFSKKFIQLISEKKLSFTTIRHIATIITDVLPHIKNLFEYKEFLLYLKGRYPILENETTMLTQYLNVEKEKKVISHLESYIKHLATQPNA